MGCANAIAYTVHLGLRALGWGGLFHYRVVAQPVPDKPLLPARRGRNIRIDMAPPTEIRSDIPLTEGDIAKRRARGALCLSAYVDDDLLGFLWLGFADYEESEVRCRFRPEPVGATAWDFDVYVRPDQRLGLVFPRLWDEANALLRSRGIAWTVSQISAYNRVSNQSHERLGAALMGQIFFLCLGAWQLTIATMPPYLHLSTGPGRMPTFAVSPPSPDPVRSEVAA